MPRPSSMTPKALRAQARKAEAQAREAHDLATMYRRAAESEVGENRDWRLERAETLESLARSYESSARCSRMLAGAKLA